MNREEFNREKFSEEEFLQEVPGDEEGYQGELADESEDELEDELEDSKKTGCLKKILALLILLAFIAFSMLDFSYLLSGKLSFLDQNRDLMEDEIVQRCKPAVVSVEASTRRGTGFNISPGGTIITNEHIVAGSKIIIIRFGDGRVFYTGDYQIIPDADIAIVKVGGDLHDLPAMEINREDRLQADDTVTIIGNPLGFEKVSQRGKVGQFHRMGDSQSLVFDIKISVNPGSSGSPVINSRAQAVGIVFASAILDTDGGSETRALAFPVQLLPK